MVLVVSNSFASFLKHVPNLECQRHWVVIFPTRTRQNPQYKTKKKTSDSLRYLVVSFYLVNSIHWWIIDWNALNRCLLFFVLCCFLSAENMGCIKKIVENLWSNGFLLKVKIVTIIKSLEARKWWSFQKRKEKQAHINSEEGSGYGKIWGYIFPDCILLTRHASQFRFATISNKTVILGAKAIYVSVLVCLLSYVPFFCLFYVSLTMTM